MVKKISRILSCILMIVMLTTLFTACGASTPVATTAAASTTTTAAPGETTTASTEATSVYPLSGDHKITAWNQNLLAHPSITSFHDAPLFKEYSKRTGVSATFTHQANAEAFKLMLASGELTDIIHTNTFTMLPGGPAGAIEQGIILPLNEYLDKWAPNLMAYLKANPDIDKLVKTDDGVYYCFPFVRGSDYLTTFIGPMVRKDLLEKAGKPAPETIADWYEVLKDLKAMGVATPFTTEMSIMKESNAFIGAFDTSFGYHLTDGKVVFGPVQDGYKEFVKEFAKWYKEGLIDPDLATAKKDQVTAKMTNGEAAVSVGHTGSRMGAYLKAMKDDPAYDLLPTKFPVINKGEEPQFGHSQPPFMGVGTVITTTCKDIEAAVRFLDYAYSEEGHMLTNFGIEGESYTDVSGYPTYSELVMKNKDGMNIAQMLGVYTYASTNGPFVQDARYMEQYSEYQQQKDALEVWKDHKFVTRRMPPVTLSTEEASAVASIKAEIDGYVDEFFLKALFGTVDIDAEWENYKTTLNNMGLEELTKANEAALERFNKR